MDEFSLGFIFKFPSNVKIFPFSYHVQHTHRKKYNRAPKIKWHMQSGILQENSAICVWRDICYSSRNLPNGWKMLQPCGCIPCEAVGFYKFIVDLHILTSSFPLCVSMVSKTIFKLFTLYCLNTSYTNSFFTLTKAKIWTRQTAPVRGHYEGQNKQKRREAGHPTLHCIKLTLIHFPAWVNKDCDSLTSGGLSPRLDKARWASWHTLLPSIRRHSTLTRPTADSQGQSTHCPLQRFATLSRKKLT